MPSEAALTCRYCSEKTEPNCPSLIGQWFNLLTDYASVEKITANLKDDHNHFSKISPSLSHHNYPLVKVGRGGKRTTLTLRLWKPQISPGPMRPTDVSQGLRLGQLLTGKCLSCLQKYFSTFLLSSIISLPSSPLLFICCLIIVVLLLVVVAVVIVVVVVPSLHHWLFSFYIWRLFTTHTTYTHDTVSPLHIIQ